MTLSKETIETALECVIEELRQMGVGEVLANDFCRTEKVARAGAELRAELNELENRGNDAA